MVDVFRLLGRGECAGLMVEGVGIDMRIRYGYGVLRGLGVVW